MTALSLLWISIQMCFQCKMLCVGVEGRMSELFGNPVCVSGRERLRINDKIGIDSVFANDSLHRKAAVI